MIEEQLKTLIAARKLIENPNQWIKGAIARTARGYECEAESGTARCFCAIGAVRRARHDLTGTPFGSYPTVNRLRDAVQLENPNRIEGESECLNTMTVADYNDRPQTTHADVLALYDRAIAATKAELQGGTV